MTPTAGPHADGFISVPLSDSPVSSASEQRLTISKSQPASRKAAVLAVMIEPILIKISAVLIEDGDCWSAQCLEYDVAAQARSLTALQGELQGVIVSHLCIAAELGRRPFENIPPAPQKFWDMFTSSNVRVNADIVPFRVPGSANAPEIISQLRVAEAA